MGASDRGGNNDLTVYIYKASGNHYVYTDDDVLTIGKWVHVTVVYDGDLTGNVERCKIYINGQLAEMDSSGTIPDTLYNASDNWYIGSQDTGAAGYLLDGEVDDVRLYTRALSASDVAELYTQGGGSILFNGALASPSSKLENTTANLLSGSTEVTLCAWLYPIGQGETVSTVGGVALALDETGSNLYLYHATSGQNLTFFADYDTTDNSSTFAVPHDTWTPVAIAHTYTADKGK
jgi:hypothetical protein